MCYNVRLVDLVANALIAVKQKGMDVAFFSFSTLEKYGACVVDYLKKIGQEAVLVLSRDKTEDFFDEFADIFKAHEENGERGVALCRKVTPSELIQRFRGYLPLDMLLAFISAESVQVLGISA